MIGRKFIGLFSVNGQSDGAAILHLQLGHGHRRFAQGVPQILLSLGHIIAPQGLGAIQKDQGIRRRGHFKTAHQQLPFPGG